MPELPLPAAKERTQVTAQILIDIDPDAYHERSEFSSTIAKTLIEKSPLHARAASPLFGGSGKKPTKDMDFGSVVHTLALGKGKRIAALDYDNFLTKDAKRDREAARAAGLVPVLQKDFERAVAAAKRIAENLRERGIVLDGESEVAITWVEETEHGPVPCKAMFDHVWLDRGRILDLKVTANAAPQFIERNAENMGYAIQEAAYRRALTALDPGRYAGRIEMLFAFAENAEPFALNLSRGNGLFRDLGEQRWQRALNTWARCIKEDRWPSYGTGVNPLSPPAWALAREEEAAYLAEAEEPAA